MSERFHQVGCKFVLVLIVMTVASTVGWQTFVTDTLYNCTDGGFLDFLMPTDWVHGEIIYLQSVAGRPMTEPDAVKVGWTLTRLRALWFAVIAASLLISYALALVPWLPHSTDLNAKSH